MNVGGFIVSRGCRWKSSTFSGFFLVLGIASGPLFSLEASAIMPFAFFRTPITAVSPMWTWVAGGNSTDAAGSFGTRLVADPANVPPGKYRSSSAADASNNLWVFGGNSADNTTWNDLWKWNGTNWIWMSGSTASGQAGVYGTKGVPDASNRPGSRGQSAMWVNSSGHIYVFGGRSAASTAWNDVWKYVPGTDMWTWVSGASTATQKTGTYGTRGVADAANTPNSRYQGCGAKDASGNFWFFGGFGPTAPIGATKYFHDLWKHDGSNWTWVAGNSATNTAGVYGTKGTPASGNLPGTRLGCAAWVDSSGNFWVFGGEGYATTGPLEATNDLWKYDPGADMWTWMKGGSAGNETGNYGTKGVADASNEPPARKFPTYWQDASGNLWLYGGIIDNATTTPPKKSDLWKYSPSSNMWTWVAGDNTNNVAPDYGALGVAASTNNPGGRFDSTMALIDSVGNLFIFGGQASNWSTGAGRRNDLWKFGP